jgi:Cd2+/Zn2+-exporting ATPase
VKLIVLALGALGMASLWEAVFADVGVTILAVLNSTRIIAPKRRNRARTV